MVGALYPAAVRGLAADTLAAQALGARALPVCTAIVSATPRLVSDVTEVPADTVAAQLEHLAGACPPVGVKIGVLGSRHAVTAVLDRVAAWKVPVVLDVTVSGPAGETVLSPAGVEAVLERLGVPDLLLVGATDAELLTGGEIASLDDAQVAAQRLVRRGARAVLLKCGPLPARHFEVGQGDGAPAPFAADLYYDGSDFSLFEAPYLPDVPTPGASSAHALALLLALVRGASREEALQEAKAYVTEAIRRAPGSGPAPSLAYFWRHERAAP